MIPSPKPVDLEEYLKGNNAEFQTKYGLPQEVRFCSTCVVSNQRPNSTIEHKHGADTKKATILFDSANKCDACHAANDKSHHEPDRPQHGRLEADLAVVHREQPIEDLGACRDRDDHRRDPEERVDAGAGAHGEEVVEPDEVRQHGNHDRGVHHRCVAEQALA